MSTKPKPNFSISAQYLGPIFSLDGELTKHAQNLIFARNGTGKSFLSRALRYLDLKSQGRDITDAAHNLVSDESAHGRGAFSFSRGTKVMGALQLEKNGSSVTANVTDTIFHVFSEDFVHEELREREYEIDGEIENQIAVDSENIKLKYAQEVLDKAVADEQAAVSALREKYEKEKLSELNEKAGINKQLREYKALSLDGLLERFAEKPDPPAQSFADILKDLDSLKAIPAEPAYPDPVGLIRGDDIDPGALGAALQKVTSPSSVSDDIKKKIDTHHSFYETGAKIVRDDHRSTCPFCEQGITNPGPKAIIDAYIAYFEDEEEKHKAELREFFRRLNQKETELKDAETQLAKQKSRYDALKRFVPSKKDTAIDDGEALFTEARAVIASIKDTIQVKAGALSSSHTLSGGDLAARIADINKIIEANNAKASELNTAVEKSDGERKALQRNACEVFDCEFAIYNWTAIEALRALRDEAKGKQSELTALEKSSPSTDARIRVAETFELLLKEFFAAKYVFDKDKFVLRRGDHEMIRGPHRTLSDGEKTAIAFCYFIACVHRKVASNSDYRKLFLVFDDPVTSMSYDFVFAIAQTLKNLGISDKGEVSINPGRIDGNKCVRPELLILTHSSYFFNISRTNRVVKGDATFSLSADGTTHKLTHLRSYVAPFEQQLAHVYHVANGNDPDHGTGNAIRSVLEAVGRFCRPDKSQSLEDFITFLAGEESVSIKSILINSLCHGTYYDETPPLDDLKLACQETIVVVERFAVGQIEIIKSAAGGQKA
ncbi:AAA family ATPase [Tepidicaulis sp. LMO-SS28]|uniref:AAA family ATPase n=1 Tax=Tepidicaulis sp. LMO-SS28 TaxID=3447455 RepID=UPI003EDF33AE